jgi:hypothetical protein
VSRGKFSNAQVEASLVEFVLVSDDLRVSAYMVLARDRNWPGPSVSISRFGVVKFEDIILRIASQHGRAETRYRWSTCPNGFKHGAAPEIFSTIEDRLAGRCADCETAVVRRTEWLATQPSFRELYPQAAQWLADPSDADTKAKFVNFRCSNCDARDVKWSPTATSLPLCHYCRTVGDAMPGDLIARRGGGEHVQLEHNLAAELRERYSLSALVHSGVVIPRGSLIVEGLYGPYPLPAVKPDVVVPAARVCIELDFNGTRFSHGDANRVEQDRHRDAVLNHVGWRVLRIRPIGSPTLADWPWRIETSSCNPRTLARLVAAAIGTSPPVVE